MLEYGEYAKFTFEEDIYTDDFVRIMLHESFSYYRCGNDVFIPAEDVSWILENVFNDWECKFELNDTEVKMGYMGKARAEYSKMIKDKAERDRKAAMTEEERRIEAWNNHYNQVAQLKERIEDMLSLARECKENGVKLPDKEEATKYGYSADFYAEGICHHVGFSKDLNCLRIENGGFCGTIDFLTDGDLITGQHESTKEYVQARQEDMWKFLREFPEFEKAFYRWIESFQED